MDKTDNNRAWLLVLPVFVLVAFSAIMPLMTVVNYSVQDIFGPTQIGSGSAPTGSRGAARRATCTARCCAQLDLLRDRAADRDPARHRASRSPCRGAAGASRRRLVLLALPLLIPWNVVGTIWQIFAPRRHRPARRPR